MALEHKTSSEGFRLQSPKEEKHQDEVSQLDCWRGTWFLWSLRTSHQDKWLILLVGGRSLFYSIPNMVRDICEDALYILLCDSYHI